MALLNINGDASPGVPYAQLSRDNKNLFLKYENLIFEMVYDRIQRIRRSHISQDPRVNVDNLLVDPVRVFVKDEPHTKVKVAQGRWRLICSVSIVDKLIETMIHSTANNWMIQNWKKIPQKPGMGFIFDDAADLKKYVLSFSKPVSTDVSGWDWSVRPWLLEADFEFRADYLHSMSGEVRDFVHKFNKLQMFSVYQFSDGDMQMLTVPGMQNSGRYCTSSSNSTMRAIVAHVVGSRKCCTMGDDCVEERVSEPHAKYAKLGIELKVYDEVTDHFEFCSHIYEFGPAYWALNAGKCLMNMLDHEYPKNQKELMAHYDLLMQFQDQFQTSPEWDRLDQALLRVGWYA